jgi:hypothetical protein
MLLDFAGRRAQKQWPVTRPAENVYAQWRSQIRAPDFLRDESGVPDERLLQVVWLHQRLRRDALKTADGKSVRVFHPGFASVEGGPDFRGAVLQIGDSRPVSGDVEIDLRAAGWRAHGHDENPNFKKVILHAVWDAEQSDGSGPPILPLKHSLDAPLAELCAVLETNSLRSLPENLRGKCCAPLRELDGGKLMELLNRAARVRLENKAAQILARAKNSGWEQALWENLFRALGYKHNVWPMQNLAETKPIWSRDADSSFELQARLLGVAGLLPGELTRAQKSSDSYLRRAWDHWWRERDAFADSILPRTVWKFHGLRPANHPQRRLALAAHWLADGNFVPKIEKWIAAETSGKRFLDSLHEILQVGRDEFWSWHWTFKSVRLARPQPLLGDARVTDLAINAILPWLWIRAKEGGSEKIQREAERRFFAWPATEDNSVLKLARQRLFGTSSAAILRSAAAQQGLMQIVRDFCEHSNAVCDDCRFPELVRGWNTRTAT